MNEQPVDKSKNSKVVTRPLTADDQYLGGNKVENMQLREEDISGTDDLNPNYKHVWMNDEKSNLTQKNPSNFIRTTKYTAANFLPLSLIY